MTKITMYSKIFGTNIKILCIRTSSKYGSLSLLVRLYSLVSLFCIFRDNIVWIPPSTIPLSQFWRHFKGSHPSVLLLVLSLHPEELIGVYSTPLCAFSLAVLWFPQVSTF